MFIVPRVLIDCLFSTVSVQPSVSNSTDRGESKVIEARENVVTDVGRATGQIITSVFMIYLRLRCQGLHLRGAT